ncbi:hypothetical protein AB7X05_09205, partial [Providencia rettgeri]
QCYVFKRPTPITSEPLLTNFAFNISVHYTNTTASPPLLLLLLSSHHRQQPPPFQQVSCYLLL